MSRKNSPVNEPLAIRLLLIAVAFIFIFLLIIIPVATVFIEAFRKGFEVYREAVTNESSINAIKLTCLVAVIAVPLNLVFGIAASWAITKFNFIGKRVLTAFIDLPFSISPVIAGLIYVLLYGTNSPIGGWLDAHGIKVIFNALGMILVTIFVTFPFVARELIPLMQEQGTDEEQAAVLLGASGWQTFFRVTLPNIKWGLLYGVLLCNARAMGEFGAVYVVSSRIQGQTNTIPLEVESLYNDYNLVGAFAVASILTILALITLAVKTIIELRFSGRAKHGH